MSKCLLPVARKSSQRRSMQPLPKTMRCGCFNSIGLISIIYTDLGSVCVGRAMGLQRALPDMVPVKPVAGGAASVEGAPSHAPVILVGANLFHCPLLYIPASVLLVWAWRGMPSGRIVYFRKSNNFNPNNQTFVKFFMSLRYSLKIIHYLCTRAVL